MITKDTTVIPLDVPELTAIQIARRSYANWKTKVPFDIDLHDYLEHGIVVNRPDVFLMAKLVDRRPRDEEGKPIGDKFDPALFVRMGVGDLRQLLLSAAAAMCPGFIPWIRFCRHATGERVREYDFERMIKMTLKTKERSHV